MKPKLLFIFLILIFTLGCQTSQPNDETLIYPVEVSESENTEQTEETQAEESTKQEEGLEAMVKAKESQQEPEPQMEEMQKQRIEELEQKNQELMVEKEVQGMEIAVLKKEINALKVEPKEVKKQPKEEEKAKTISKEKRYYLRIISLPFHDYYDKMSKKIVAHLKKQGMTQIKKRKSGKYWVIDVGDFTSIRNPEAVALKEKIIQMKYQGIQQFKDAYWNSTH